MRVGVNLAPITSRSPFVGREMEMQMLVSALEEADRGNGRIVSIAGEPGIGKSRCVEELDRIAEERGFCVLWGHCQESLAMPAYWPWIEALETLIRRIEARTLAELLGPHAPVAGELLPDIRQKIPEIGTPLQISDPQSAQFRIYHALFEFIRAASSDLAMVIVLEDINWADTQTLALLEFFAARAKLLRCLLIGTYRDTEVSLKHPINTTLGELMRSGSHERIALRRLEKTHVREYVRKVARGAAANEKIESIFRRTEGNPLFLREAVRQLNEHGDVDAVAGGIRDVIRRRLKRLSDDCIGLLEVAAVIGRDFRADLLAEITGTAEETDVIARLDEAVQMGFLEEMEAEFGTYRFFHAMMQEALLEEVPAAKRAQLHAEVAGVFERSYGLAAVEHASELLGHCAGANGFVGADKVVKYAILAGNRALETEAYEDAARHFEMGLDAAGSDSPMDNAKAALSFGIGLALCSRPIENSRNAGDSLLEAFDYYVNTNQIERAVEVASRVRFFGGLNAQDILRMSEAALDLVEEGAVEEARIRCVLSHCLLSLGYEHYTRAIEELSVAVQTARKHNDPNLEMRALSILAKAYSYVRKPEKALEAAEEGLRIKASDDLHLREGLLRQAASIHARAMANPEKALSYYADVDRLSRIIGYPSSTALQLNVLLLCDMGCWEEARKLIASDAAPTPHPFLKLNLSGIEFECGNAAAGEAIYAERIKEIETSEVDDFWGKVGIAGGAAEAVRRGASRDLLELAERYFIEAQNSLRARGVESGGFYALLKRGEAKNAAAMGNIETARARYAEIPPPPDEWFVWGGHDAHGYICRVIGDLDSSLRYFSISEDYYERAGYKPKLAWIRYDIALTLIEMGDDASLNRAKEKLTSAQDIAKKLGMVPLGKLISEKLAALEALDSDIDVGRAEITAGSRPAGLTEREVEVLSHLALGKTSQEIGSDLYISVKTVHNHLSHIFEKLDVGNRVEATREALKLRIVSPDEYDGAMSDNLSSSGIIAQN